MGESGTLRVLAYPYARNRARNAYTAALYDHMGEAVRTAELKISRPPFRSLYDVVHIHWPEFAVTGSTPSAVGRALTLAALVQWQRLRGAVFVRTVHNRVAHDTQHPLLSKLLTRFLGRLADAEILLLPAASCPGRHITRVIPHHLYPAPRAAAGGLGHVDVLWFGRIRTYKGVTELARQCAEGSAWTLRIAGAGDDPDVVRELQDVAADSDRIDLRVGFIDDAELDELLASCSVVCLPYRKVTNSGAAFRAFTAGRPVLLPDSDFARALRDQVGAGWVHVYDEPLEPADIRAAAEDRERPTLARFAPDVIAAETLALYRELIAARRGR